ncbi:MAG TPA: hypothetical protein VD772_07780, partial [Anseongella sp.]|nr:hypothetical protein [Anseongella sp.]
VPDPKAPNEVLREYFEKIIPEYDKEKVYISDIKKILAWYRILSGLPLFTEEEEAEETPE